MVDAVVWCSQGIRHDRPAAASERDDGRVVGVVSLFRDPQSQAGSSDETKSETAIDLAEFRDVSG